MLDISLTQDNLWVSALAPGLSFRKCENYAKHNVCNWLIPSHHSNELCPACRTNDVIPNLTIPENLVRWYRLERAKRRVIYNLYRAGLQVISKEEQADIGLEFCFMEDVRKLDAYGQELVTYKRIMTGHHMGTITINVDEADHSKREAMRENMNEDYRTPLGHIRHEVGHYYWDRLIANSNNIDSFRAVFGDERHDYQKTLKKHYENGPRANWQDSFISAYASSHPWEDWAETWAHYLHITDTMETAYDFGFIIEGRAMPQPLSAATSNTTMQSGYFDAIDFDQMLTDWLRLTIAMNALNRSMGLRDAYPFSVSKKVGDKLRYVHDIITTSIQQRQ